ncbi:uncharacterized protein LOC143348149 [Colletes latitarsis]|uniref:uncharacterized protein LOC143348149 n=1 Tax=Colletes latitarsis TaxID=2605962 RepID=UPI0040373E4F
MQDEISCEDPQFMNMLESCLLVEVKAAKQTLLGLQNDVKDFKSKVQSQLKTRKELKEAVQNAQENITSLTASLNKYAQNSGSQSLSYEFTLFNVHDRETKTVSEISSMIQLMSGNLDSDYKIMMLETERYDNILKEYENTWQMYHAKYEEFPLAKVRMEEKVKLEKLSVQKMVVEYKINEIKKMSSQRDRITWLRMRGKIVELSSTIVNYRQLEQQLTDLDKCIGDRKEDLNTINNEIAVRTKMAEEEKNVRAMKLLEMPPPTVHFAQMRTIYETRLKTSFADGWKRNLDNFDSMSVDTVMLEEMCLHDESNSSIPIRRSQIQSRKRGGSSDIASPYPAHEEEPERENASTTSETDGNAEQEAIDTIEERDHRMDHQEEEEVQPGNTKRSMSSSKDKRSAKENKSRADVEDEDVSTSKRMKLIEDALPASTLRERQMEKNLMVETRCSVSPMPKRAQGSFSVPRSSNYSFRANSNVSGPKGSGLVELASSGLRISKIESVRYNVLQRKKMMMDQDDPTPSSSRLDVPSPSPSVENMAKLRYIASPLTKIARNNRNPSGGLAERAGSSSQMIAKIGPDRYASPTTKPNLANSNLSMFTPGHFEYSDNSNISFFVNNNLPDLKGDQISLYEGSVRDYCECSNISTPRENAPMDPPVKNTAKLPARNSEQNFSQFDFSNIMKKNTERKHLF